MVDPNDCDLQRQREMQQAREDEERLKQKILALKKEQDKILFDKIKLQERQRAAKIVLAAEPFIGTEYAGIIAEEILRAND
jgi:nicotinate-nucleotide pyrophosphorylase